MVIEIHGVPEFTLHVTPAMVAVLMLCSKHHYDVACQQAGQFGGCVYRWQLCMQFAKEEKVSESYTVRGSFRDLDTTLKILEIAWALPEAKRDWASVRVYVKNVQRALSFANHICTSKVWDLTIP
jgi:hypothetical protein